MAVLTLAGKPIDWHRPPKATTRVMWSKRDRSGRRVTGSFRTICHIDHLDQLAVKKFGVGLSLFQPPYNTGYKPSANTHDYDACIDAIIPGVSWSEQLKFFRWNGHGGWVRVPPAFIYHWHGFTLPPREGTNVSDDFASAGFKVGKYVDGGYSLYGRKVASSQIEDYYNHRTGLSGHARDGSPYPPNIGSTVFDLKEYVARQRKRVPALNRRAIQHDDFYARGNSPVGDKGAARRKVWADRDAQPGKGGTIYFTHWPHPRTEQFAYPDGKIPKQSFQKLSRRNILSLRTKDGGYGIRTSWQGLRDAKQAGVPGVEIDLKFVPSERQFKRLARQAKKAYGKNWKRRVEVKMSCVGPGAEGRWMTALRRAHKAGFTTTVLRFGGDPSTLPDFVTKYRLP